MFRNILIETFNKEFEESLNLGGLDYEMKVYESMKSARIPGLNVGDKPGAGFSNVGSGDIEASYKNKPFNIEIKASINDQMGGGSVAFDYETNNLTPSKKLKAGSEPEDLDMILKTVESKIPEMDAYLEALFDIEPTEFHRLNKGIPFIASKEAREELKQSGHHKAINSIVKLSEKYVTNLYNAKNVYYIQVGGAGLFYMGKDPLNLGVPAFSGEVNVEIRLGFSGGKLNFPTEPPTPARRAELRCIGRMKTKSKSPYTLDDPDSVIKLFKK